MKKKITSATILFAILMVIVCFAVMYDLEQRRYAYVWESAIRVPTGGFSYCIQPGGEFSEAGSDVSTKKGNLLVEYKPNQKVSEELTEIDKRLLEKLSKISIRESEGVTREQFITEIESWGAFYNAPLFSENVGVLFDVAQEEGYNEYFYPMLAMVETTGGKYQKGNFNTCNLTEKIDGEETVKAIWKNFESDEECIREFFRILDGKPYESVTTLTEFTAIWAPDTEKYPYQAEQYAIAMWLARERAQDFL